MVAVIQPRIVKVSVGPPGGLGREWSELFIDAHVEKSTGKTPNTAKAEIYNLSPISLQWLEQPNQIMQILAGETIAGQIFTGELRTGEVKTRRVPPNFITTLEAQDGKAVFQTGYFTGSYPPGTTRTQILTDALAINVIAIGYIGTLPERVYESAPSFSAPLDEVLDELYAGELASWSIQDGTFQLIALGIPVPGNVPVISPETGMIGSPERKDKGVEVSTKFGAQFNPGGSFVVSSRIWSGAARITKVIHDIDSEGRKWQTDLTGVPLK